MALPDKLYYPIQGNLTEVGIFLYELGVAVMVSQQVAEIERGAVTVRPAASAQTGIRSARR